MRTEKITVSFSADKLQAIRILKPDVYESLEKTLAEQLDKIYVRSIPISTREYIEAKMKDEEVTPKK